MKVLYYRQLKTYASTVVFAECTPMCELSFGTPDWKTALINIDMKPNWLGCYNVEYWLSISLSNTVHQQLS